MSGRDRLDTYMQGCPLIAIIRGVMPDEVEGIAGAILEAGIRIIEVPLNSPEPLKSIERLARRFGDEALVGGGTVLHTHSVAEVRSAGGHLIVSPNTNVDVIKAAVSEGMVSCPGYFTPTEAFAAYHAGASALKLFPAEAASPAVLKAQLAVIPREAPVIVVGGVKPDNIRDWVDAGAAGFGLGGGLYKPGQSVHETREKARAYVAAVQAL